MSFLRDWDEWLPGFLIGLIVIGGVILLILLAVSDIKKSRADTAPAVEVADQKTGDRFVVEQGGKFTFADDVVNYRRIIIIHDKLTGKEYMGVQGYGTVEITERHEYDPATKTSKTIVEEIK